MAQLELKGNNLGEKHLQYNKLLKEALTTNKTELGSEDCDISNLLKIDIANNNRNVEYILEVLKCEDMLYVSRAIKNSTWLITDIRYAHIINPEYLCSQLFPQMTSKAINKFMLHIRLNLKDENRVEGFYNHQKNDNPRAASKWLPRCSLALVEKIVEKNANDLNMSLLKRLCQKSITVLEIFVHKYRYYLRSALEIAMFLIYKHTEKYLDIVESVREHQMPNFGRKPTKTIMTSCPGRILNKFDLYASKIDIPTFAKYLKTEDIKDFLLKQIKNEKLQYWFQINNLKHFIKYIPKEGRFEYLKQLFIDKTYKNEVQEHLPYEDFESPCCITLRCAIENKSKSSNICHWYRFAPFNVAFTDLKKMIRVESSPDERNEMLAILLISANRNLQHIQVLLQYYHDKHINEPFKFKSQFVNNLLSKSKTHEYDEKTWNILNTLFHSMEVYAESDNNVQTSIGAIIVYKVLHNESVPEIIEEKFSFDTLKKYQTKLNDEQGNQLFQYLYDYIQTKINSKDIEKSEAEFKESFELLKNIIKLLIDWKKELIDYPWVLNKIKEHIKIKKQKLWNVDMKSIYNIKKCWRKYMFEVSLLLNPCEEVCLNALKHDPEILIRCKREVDALCFDDTVSMKRLLNKLRIYWSQTLAMEWSDAYRGRLEQSSGHKAVIRGFCAILQRNDLLIIIKKYEPKDPKINWSEDEKLILSLRKHIAMNMYSARPQPNPDSVLPYAKGDYLQYALPSLNAIFYNLSSSKSREYIPKLLDAPVSIQKHGIRLAFTKLNSNELKDIFSKLWTSTKNSSIRAVLFKTTYDLLCKEKNTVMIEEIYGMLDIFIDNLTSDENRSIYNTLSKVDKVPLPVRGKFCMKSYNFLKSLPAKANCESFVIQVLNETKEVAEYLDQNFVSNLLLEYIDNKYTKKRNEYREPTMLLMSSYLLCSKNEEEQTQKYDQILIPLMERSFALWDNVKDKLCYIKANFNDLLNNLEDDYKKVVLKKKMITPIKMFTDIHTKLENTLSVQENYVMLRNWKLTVAFVKLLDKYKPLETNTSTPEDETSDTEDDNKLDVLYVKAAADFGKICHQYLKEDIKLYFPSTYMLFLKALEDILRNFELKRSSELEIYKSIVECKDLIQSHLLVLEMLPDYIEDEHKAIMVEIRKLISTHPSEEVKMHYYETFKDNPDPNIVTSD